ncbi:MAG: hypothetical protein JXL85_03455, partial [Bacilli bacterium]|nr:hypothetical protein [Bacilli bacterium]
MNQRYFYSIVLLMIALTASGIRPLPMNIYRITARYEYDIRYQARRTIEKYDYEESEWSSLDLVPIDFDMKCYSQWDHWLANGLADRLGKPIAWQRNIQWTNDCKDEKYMYVPSDVYSIVLSRNPMAVYPRYSVFEDQLITNQGIPFDYFTQWIYPYTNNGVTYNFIQVQYSFKVEDTYVFVDQVMTDRDVDKKEIAVWVDTLANE